MDKYDFEKLRVDGRIILKRIIKSYGGIVSGVMKFRISLNASNFFRGVRLCVG
jgi:hypothetical protein